MCPFEPGSELDQALHDVLGYLNFSAGAEDPALLRNLDRLFRAATSRAAGELAQDVVHGWLQRGIEALKRDDAAFADIGQATAVIELLFRHFLPAYRRFHGDLLRHQSDGEWFNSFFIGYGLQSVLCEGPPWDETDRIIEGALATLNDFIGHRPVAVLENEQKMKPYAHEWVRPIPLYVHGAGVSAGRYEPMVTAALDILRRTDADLLARACFDTGQLAELALDPRVLDFEHPASRRPNYQFGCWDPHSVDHRGYYRRFVLQQVSVEVLWSYAHRTADGDAQDGAVVESATVLAGTMLMASAISGGAPGTHDSRTTLATLMPHIAAYRDDFYEQWLGQTQGDLGRRLKEEAVRLRQPFAAVRQHLNLELARRRADQLQHTHLARILARMGYPDAAMRHAEAARTVSARMTAQIESCLAAGQRPASPIDLGQLAGQLAEAEDLLHRSIECGALVDPWNIIGFGGNFSLFPAVENSIRDERVATLVEWVTGIFGLCARGWSDAVAGGDGPLRQEFSDAFQRLAHWWDAFATTTVSGLRSVEGQSYQSATQRAATSLSAWRDAGAAAGDIAFWRDLVDRFDSPKSFQLVIQALLDRDDHVASMALLMQWLSQADTTPLDEPDSSFYGLVARWIRDVERLAHEKGDDAGAWPLVCKFIDYLEANAEELWQVPEFELGHGDADNHAGETDEAELLDDEDDEDPDRYLLRAAYEGVTYRDSTDDGVESDMMDEGSGSSEHALQEELYRISSRLAFLSTVARLWKRAAVVWGWTQNGASGRADVLRTWFEQARSDTKAMARLASSVHRYPIQPASGGWESMVEYDRMRSVQEVLLERIISTWTNTAQAAEFLDAAAAVAPDEAASGAARVFIALAANDAAAVHRAWGAFVESLQSQPILYRPVEKGGAPRQMARARFTLKQLHVLLDWLPRQGHLKEACGLLKTAHAMEVGHPLGAGAVSEFDRLFSHGLNEVARAVIRAGQVGSVAEGSERGEVPSDEQLNEALSVLTGSLHRLWLVHSRSVRLSTVEALLEPSQWKTFVRFVKRYGSDLLTQNFFHLGNVRAILGQGADRWLAQLDSESDPHGELKVVEDIRQGVISRKNAAKQLTLVLEIVAENYEHYRDYNSSTTLSDHGELFDTLVDFLRLKCQYDRTAWRLKPWLAVYSLLVEHDRGEAAALWRRQIEEQTREAADAHQARLEELVKEYAATIPTIADRIAERFVKPLSTDRALTLVRPAMQQASEGSDNGAFDQLDREIETLVRQPTGVGLDVPGWIEALEHRVATMAATLQGEQVRDDLRRYVPQRTLRWDEVLEQLELLDRVMRV